MRELNTKIASGTTEEYQLDGQYIRNDDAMPTIRVTVYSADHFEERATIRAGDAVRFDAPFVRVQITHDEASDQTITIGYGNGEIMASRFSGTVDVLQGSSLTNVAPVSVGIADTLLLAADSTRKMIHVKNTHATAIVKLGGAGVAFANAAIELLPGEEWRETDIAAAAWYAISDTAATPVNVLTGS